MIDKGLHKNVVLLVHIKMQKEEDLNVRKPLHYFAYPEDMIHVCVWRLNMILVSLQCCIFIDS